METTEHGIKIPSAPTTDTQDSFADLVNAIINNANIIESMLLLLEI